MRPIHLAKLDKTRPVLVLTRAAVLPYLHTVTVAPITSTVRGIGSELTVGRANGLDHESVVNLDNIVTIDNRHLGRAVGHLLPRQEAQLAAGLTYAFALA